MQLVTHVSDSTFGLHSWGRVSFATYDAIDRVSGATITPGAGVSADTSFEVFRYDGLSRLASAQDDDSLVTREYDSHDNVVREVQNGESTQVEFSNKR